MEELFRKCTLSDMEELLELSEQIDNKDFNPLHIAIEKNFPIEVLRKIAEKSKYPLIVSDSQNMYLPGFFANYEAETLNILLRNNPDLEKLQFIHALAKQEGKQIIVNKAMFRFGRSFQDNTLSLALETCKNDPDIINEIFLIAQEEQKKIIVPSGQTTLLGDSWWSEPLLADSLIEAVKYGCNSKIIKQIIDKAKEEEVNIFENTNEVGHQNNILHMALSKKCSFDTIKYILSNSKGLIINDARNGFDEPIKQCNTLSVAIKNYCQNDIEEIFQDKDAIIRTLLDYGAKEESLPSQELTNAAFSLKKVHIIKSEIAIQQQLQRGMEIRYPAFDDNISAITQSYLESSNIVGNIDLLGDVRKIICEISKEEHREFAEEEKKEIPDANFRPESSQKLAEAARIIYNQL